MLPSKGYFRALECPYYSTSFCDRPYCHFKHSKQDSIDVENEDKKSEEVRNSSFSEESNIKTKLKPRIIEYVPKCIKPKNIDLDNSNEEKKTCTPEYVPSMVDKPIINSEELCRTNLDEEKINNSIELPNVLSTTVFEGIKILSDSNNTTESSKTEHSSSKRKDRHHSSSEHSQKSSRSSSKSSHKSKKSKKDKTPDHNYNTKSSSKSDHSNKNSNIKDALNNSKSSAGHKSLKEAVFEKVKKKLDDSIVSPGVPMEIALNKESKRKTPVAIAFRNGDRTFGEDALTVCVRFPSNCYIYFLDLLGKQIDNPTVEIFRKRFPYYDIIADENRNTILFKHTESNEVFSPEELVAMMLEKARDFAQDSAGQPINEAVITVPCYFGQAERFAMLKAAEIAGIKVLQLINSYTAAALNYGIFRTKSFNETSPMYMLFYDMGAYSTQATVVSYQLVKSKDKVAPEIHPQLTVLGVGYERNLGGLEIQFRLRDYLAKKFNSLKLTSNDVTKNPRAMAKLFKEAGRVKNVLSANTDHFAQVEGLIDEKDMRIKVTREELDELCKDLFDRVTVPAQRALESSGLTIDIIEQVMLAGAGTRVPKVQERLIKDLKISQPLGRSLNTDEAAALGAAYKAADLSNGFKVKPFITKDATLFPIQVIFDKEITEEDKPTKQVKRMLFGPMNPYPQRKILTFNKHKKDFAFMVGYAELSHLPEYEIKALGPLTLSSIKLNGVKEAFSKHQETEDIDTKGIKAHFALDESGLLVLQNVELLIQKTIRTDDEEQSTLSKIGNTISNLFKGPEEVLKDEKTVNETLEEENSIPPQTSANFTQNSTTETLNKSNNSTEPIQLNSTSSETDIKKNSKVVTIKETINISQENLFVNPPDGDVLQKSINKISQLKQKDLEKSRKETSLNNLETAIIETREKLEQPDYADSATSEEVQQILDKCSETSNWLEDEGFGATAEKLDLKLDDLVKVVRPIWERAMEHLERPAKLEALDKALNSGKTFLAGIHNSTLENTPFTQVEIDTLDKLINEISAWKIKQVAEQEKLSKSTNPIITVQAISLKQTSIEREMRYLMNKFTSWIPPKKKEEPKKNDSKTENDKTETLQEQENDSTIETKASEKENINDSESKIEPEQSETGENPSIEPTKSDEKKPDEHSEL
ncbi:hypoxia up-regulated protein 1 isoform X2 [Daktulosphaira vitifoliae]|uniref:hypoxia up-regulated protein 1 isoform X2 n=1 Tax=Daktulosphaira vitifoliae TaxID=58002 RepID=UPI0021AAAA59|nr:hypoxia up-regulated protein 1 isoform X2 [Daktulosphaira vitifoliae]